MSRKPRFVRPRGKPASTLPRNLEIDITELGGRGDGIGSHEGQPVFVPCTVPGDRVLARVDGRKSDGLAATCLHLLEAGPGRIAPACSHFGDCGGCALQHLDGERYAAWKRDQLVIALRRAGFAEDLVAPMIRVAPGTRRRATFAFLRRRADLLLGFHARASHQLVDVVQCPLLAAPLLGLLPPLRALLREIIEDGREGDAIVTLTENGLDVLIEAEARLDLFDRERLAAFAERLDLARLSWRRPGQGRIEPLAHRRSAMVRFAGIGVDMPPGAFFSPAPRASRRWPLWSLTRLAPPVRSPICSLAAAVSPFQWPKKPSSMPSKARPPPPRR